MPHVPPTPHGRASHRLRRRGTHDFDAQDVALNDSDQVRSQELTDQQWTSGNIMPGSVGAGSMAASIRPVAIVSTLPTLPDGNFPPLSYVVLTSDNRLYKNIGDVWVKGVDGSEIVTDSITAGQIAAGAISTSELAAGQITLFDEYGATSLTPSGFSGAWQEFIADGIYNSSFRTGIAGTLPDGRNTNLPFWTVYRNDLTSASVVVDASWPGGRYVEAVPSAEDGYIGLGADRVSVSISEPVFISAVAAAVSAGGSVPVVTASVLFYASDGTTLVDTAFVSLATFASSNTIAQYYSSGPIYVPDESKFADVHIFFSELVAHSGSTRMRLGGVSMKQNQPIGMQSQAWPLGTGPFTSFPNTANLIVDRAYIQPIHIDSYLAVQSVGFHSTDTSLGRSVEYRIYKAQENDSSTLVEIPGHNGILTWTASATGVQLIPAGPGPRLSPGTYWIALRNRAATNTLGVSYAAALDNVWYSAYHSAHGALGATFDMSAATQISTCIAIWLVGWSGGYAWGY